MEHQTLSRWVVRPIDPATQCIILKIKVELDFECLTWKSIPLWYLLIVYCPLRSCIFKVMFVWEKHKCLSNDETVYVWDNDTRLTLWQYGLWRFQTGVTKSEIFLPKNQHTQRKLLNFENWVSGEVSKIGHNFSK